MESKVGAVKLPPEVIVRLEVEALFEAVYEPWTSILPRALVAVRVPEIVSPVPVNSIVLELEVKVPFWVNEPSMESVFGAVKEAPELIVRSEVEALFEDV